MDRRTQTEGSYNKKNIAITIGDPKGVGPEITAKSLKKFIPSNEFNFVVFGKEKIMRKAIEITEVELSVKKISSFEELSSESINIFEIDEEEDALIAFRAIEKACECAMRGEVLSIITCPISKEKFKKAGLKFHSHTELLAYLTKTKYYRMMFSNEKINLVLHTIHIPLREIFSHLSVSSIEQTINISTSFMRKFMNIANPKVLVCGINPHAGENGLMGNEEKEIISPAIENLRRKGLNIEGPAPPDTAFFVAIEKGFDLVVCMYHDQGLIAVKTLDFHGTINITAGLPFLRCSPDHGTAFDIAWKNKANPSSMIKAIEFATKFSK